MTAERILVVDDVPRNVKLLSDILAGAGYEVVTASSGADALEQVARDQPDLVLLDVVMPGMSGYDVCKAIRENAATKVLPVVMVTALEETEERVRGLEAGADDFLSKPIRQPELLARVRSLLRAKHLYDTIEEQAAQLAEWNRTLESRVAEQVAQIERLAKLARFLPPQIVARVIAGDADDPLQSHRREIAVVSLDLRGFTAFAETSAPEEVMAVLQEYHRTIGRLVVEHEGTIERFTGDAVTVFFNDPVPQADAVERAVRMAMAMREATRLLATAWQRRGIELNLGFGIAQGYATLGAIGFEGRSDYTAIGSVGSMAARLCEEAAPGEILMSQRVFAAVDHLVETEPAGELTLRGFRSPAPTFRALRVKSPAAPLGGEPSSDGRSAKQTFRQEGEYWTIEFAGAGFRLKDSKGMRYIGHLLRQPEQEFHALTLIAAGRTDGEESSLASRIGSDEVHASGLGDAGAILDTTAKEAYRRRLHELRAELAEAESINDSGTAGRAREEIDFLSQQLAAAVGLGGRDRRAAAAAERARVNVTRSISDTVKRIREHSAPLARHLEGSLRTGTFCSYRPPDLSSGTWEL